MDFYYAEGTSMTPTEEAIDALDARVDRERLSKEERVEYDRLLQERYPGQGGSRTC